ncbi:MAG: hypothetical protein ACODAA_06030 [Gemmatimonadota bacterium]
MLIGRSLRSLVLPCAALLILAGPAVAQRSASQFVDATRASSEPAATACPGERHRASDYAIGEWVGTVKIPEADGTLRVDTTVTSEARLETAADGCALVEWRVVRRDGRDPTHIITVRAYDPESGRWHQFLASSRPALIRFRGEIAGGDLRFVAPRAGGDGSEDLVRVTDRRIDGTGFDRVIESSENGGRSWVLEDVVEYRSP